LDGNSDWRVGIRLGPRRAGTIPQAVGDHDCIARFGVWCASSLPSRILMLVDKETMDISMYWMVEIEAWSKFCRRVQFRLNKGQKEHSTGDVITSR
jgi:hypothetical protein